MIRLNRQVFSALSRTKEAVKGTTKEIAKDLKRTVIAANETLKDDFRAIAGAVAENSNQKFNEDVTHKFHDSAEEARKFVPQDDRKFVLNDKAENHFNKTAKMVHDTKKYFNEKVSSTQNSTEFSKGNT